MIRFSKESPVICETCGQKAIRRELPVEGRMTSFDTHSLSITDKQWFAAIGRMDRFVTKAKAFEQNLQNQLPLNLDKGSLVFADIGTVRPTACERRIKIIIYATVKAFAGQKQIQTPPIELKVLRVDKAIKTLQEIALPAVEILRRDYEEGRF